MPKLNLKPNWLPLGPTSNCLVWANFQLPSLAQLPSTLCILLVQPCGYTILQRNFRKTQYSRAAVLFIKRKSARVLFRKNKKGPKKKKITVQPTGYTLEIYYIQQYSRAAILFFKEIFKKPSIAARLYYLLKENQQGYCTVPGGGKKKKKKTKGVKKIQYIIFNNSIAVRLYYLLKEEILKTPARVGMNRFLLFPWANLPYYQAYE